MKTQSLFLLATRWGGSLIIFGFAAEVALAATVQFRNDNDAIGQIGCVSNENGMFVRISEAGGILASSDGRCWSERSLGIRTFMRGVNYGAGLFVAVGGSYVDLPGVILTSADGLNWNRRQSGTKKNLYGVAYGNATFVAVGDDGAILVSRTGVDWRSSHPPSAELLTAVTYGNGRFLAVGEQGLTLTSIDGLHWGKSSVGSAIYFNRVSFINGLFTATSSNASFFSSDGRIWAPRNAITNLVMKTK